jgi:hypothetical protein
MRAAKARYQLRDGSLFLMLAACTSLLMFPVIMSFLLVGIYHYGGTNSSLALFADKRYKFPLQEFVFPVMMLIFWTMAVYLRNSHNETWAESGIRAVRAGRAAKFLMRLLAMAGILNVGFLLGYCIPYILTNLNGSEWPPELQDKSYYTSGICGEGTLYACNGMARPIYLSRH